MREWWPMLLSETKSGYFYGFRGADSNSIGLFRERLKKGSRESEFPLSISWRCPYQLLKKPIDM